MQHSASGSEEKSCILIVLPCCSSECKSFVHMLVVGLRQLVTIRLQMLASRFKHKLSSVIHCTLPHFSVMCLVKCVFCEIGELHNHDYSAYCFVRLPVLSFPQMQTAWL